MRVSWPVSLTEGAVTLRPLRQRDATAWREVRARNAEWLGPWESTLPGPDSDRPASFGAMVRLLKHEARAGRNLGFAITHDDRFVGQITLGGITWGSLRGAYVGYWIDQAVAGQGIAPTAVAMVCDHAWFNLQLHRIEVNVRPENERSLRVVDKLGFRREGVRPRYLHIDGEWRDHVSFALNSDEVPGGLLARWRGSNPASL
ncbi:MAG: GNAT family protein [Actinobacteria bacterium]|nr:GNAT family protein [Actinomycetota bacterium]